MKKNILILILLLVSAFFGYHYYNNNISKSTSTDKNTLNVQDNSVGVGNIDNFRNNVSKDFLDQTHLYKIGDNQFSQEIKTVFSNIDVYLKDRTDKTLTLDEVYYPIASILGYGFIESANDCEDIVTSYGIKNKEYFLKECHFVVESKKALIDKKEGENIPDYLKEYNKIFAQIEKGKCDEGYLLCSLLFENIDQEVFFEKFSKELGNQNIDELKKDISPVLYGIYSYYNQTHNLGLSTLGELFYYKAALFRSMYTGKDSCEIIENQGYRKYCYDVVEGNNKEHYEKLYKEFFIYLYVNIDEV